MFMVIDREDATLSGDLDDKRLVVSSLTGRIPVHRPEARGTIEMHDMHATSNGMSSTYAARQASTERFHFRPRRKLRAQLRGNHRADGLRISATRASRDRPRRAICLFTSERIVGTSRPRMSRPARSEPARSPK